MGGTEIIRVLGNSVYDGLASANSPSSLNPFATIADLTASLITDLDPVINQQTTPPGGPSTGDRYLVAIGGLGAWAGQDNNIAEWDGLAWVYTVPVLDNVVYVTNTLTTLRWNGSAWVSYPGTAILNYGNSVTSPLRVGTKTNQLVYLIVNNTPVGRLGNASNGFLNDTYIGSLLTAPSARLHVRGSNTSSGTFAFLAQNANPTTLFHVANDGGVFINGGVGVSETFGIRQVAGKNDVIRVTNSGFGNLFGIYDNGGAGITDAYISLFGINAGWKYYHNIGSTVMPVAATGYYSMAVASITASKGIGAFTSGAGGGIYLRTNASNYFELEMLSTAGAPSNMLLSSDSDSYLAGISTANLGVGITPSGAKFHIKGSGNDNTTYWLKSQNSDNEVLYAHTNGGIIEHYTNTAVGASVTDGYLQYSADVTAGNAAPHFKTESGNVIKLFTSPAYTVTNLTTDRSYNANVTNILELADVLGTLIADLQATGIIG